MNIVLTVTAISSLCSSESVFRILLRNVDGKDVNMKGYTGDFNNGKERWFRKRSMKPREIQAVEHGSSCYTYSHSDSVCSPTADPTA